MLRLQHVAKTYANGVAAVSDVSFDVRDGELLVLFGPSGCGKTTLLRLIAGLEEVTAGSIAWDGATIDRLPPRRRDVAMVFQEPALYPHLRVRGNLAFALKLRGLARSEIDHRIHEATAALGIEDLLERRAWELSGGQRQRVALARAIARRARLVLLDEPLSSLDAPLRMQLRREIRRIQQQFGATMIYVTHDQSEALTLGDHIAVMHAGRIEQLADPQTVYDRPATRFVAGLLGTPPMNFLEGRIERGAGDPQFVSASCDWRLPLPEAHALAGPILLGIRPEFVGASTDTDGHPEILRGVVESMDRSGPECHVRVQTPAGAVVCRVPSFVAFRIREPVALTFLPSHLCWFDPATGKAKMLESGSAVGDN